MMRLASALLLATMPSMAVAFAAPGIAATRAVGLSTVRPQQPVRMVAAAEVVSAVDAIHTTSMMLSDATAATDSSLTAFLAQLIAVGPVGIAVVAASVALVIGVAYTLANAFITDVLPVVLQIGAFVAFIEFFGVVPPPL